MAKEKQNISIFQNGQNQITKIFREFEKCCDEAIIRREGKRLILEPKKRLSSISGRLNPLKNSFPDMDITLLPIGDIRI